MALLDSGFRPSQHGLPFANDMGFGLCGGFVRLARKRFLADEPVPQTRSALRLFLEQLGSLHPVELLKVVTRTTATTADLRRRSRGERLSLRWRLRSVPTPLMLIYAEGVSDIFGNHQVLAWAVDDNLHFGDDQIFVYDPNQPGNDQVTLASLAARGWYCMD